MKRVFNKLAYENSDQMIFGSTLHPINCGFGLEIGNGVVYPEVNYTLPTMHVVGNKDKVKREYDSMVTEILQRALKLDVPGIVLEFEQTFDLTDNPSWGAEVARDTKAVMKDFYDKHGLKSALRVTVADIRDKVKPPLMRQGAECDKMLESFELCAAAGADILSIESTGGKEVADQSILECDISGVLFAVGLLGSRDMEFLWNKIVNICKKKGVVPGGDTDCAHSNTAMRLAFMDYIPQTFAALVRAIGAARSLVAFEQGATGPHKDCGYEGPILKAITGMPISMEGKGCACAHASYMGNVASAVCDLWSNESVQHVRLLGGFAPEVFTEVLAYDCRLMNQAVDTNQALALRNMMVESDTPTSPEALVIAPEPAFRIAQTIVENDSYYQRARFAAITALNIIKEAILNKKLTVPERELSWLERFNDELNESGDEKKIISEMTKEHSSIFKPKEYGL